MFTHFKVTHFRTHISSSLSLSSVNLVIGPNSAGKTNLLSAITTMANIFRTASTPDSAETLIEALRLNYPRQIKRDHLPAMEYSIGWSGWLASYSLHLIINFKPTSVDISFEISISNRKEGGISRVIGPFPIKDLQKTISNLPTIEEREELHQFLSDIKSIQYLQLEPSSLRRDPDLATLNTIKSRLTNKALHPKAIPGEFNSGFGTHGERFATMLAIALEADRTVYKNFKQYLQSFDEDFQDVEVSKRGKLIWNFRSPSEGVRYLELPSSALSDGFLRAAALALISASYQAPALLLLEEVENGISVGNLRRLIQWLRLSTKPVTDQQTRRGVRTQYLLTSHSPIVLREFRSSLDSVYQVRYERKLRQSVCVDLSSSISALINLGIVEGKPEERDSYGKILSPVKIDDDSIISLWLQQVIGADGKPRVGA